ncbi:SRPBCC family protein [Phragmitibacter flavus]|uniref:SRPBCC family protein n=1 Tax=Phragmitibacter flavus TaxID=2576071 RepID=A0A5R8KFD1_9BACT|nr:SRPBCC family protein [Phragmitibacter flavus]TLD71004.1 SRPBCC family protein [Phragmitibacter flavus]
MEHTLETNFELSLPPEAVFDFFSDASNLQRITPPELEIKILTPEPILMQRDTVIEYRLKLLGVPYGWTTHISGWQPPICFVDEQTRGPFKKWVHLHAFEPTEKGTRVRDVVTYRLRFPPFGQMVQPLVHAHLKRIFAYRQKAIVAELAKAD